MTGPKGNGEFCFPETLNVPRGEAEGNIEVKGKQNSLFPVGPVNKCFVIPLTGKWYKIPTNCLLDPGLHSNLPWFQGTQPDHVRVESSNYCFPRELLSFDPWHLTCSPPIGKHI